MDRVGDLFSRRKLPLTPKASTLLLPHRAPGGTRNALFLILIVGLGGSYQDGHHMTAISSPSPFIQRFINSSWYDRYEEPPSPHTVTLIWSVVVSTYAVGGILGCLSVKFVTGLIGIKKAIICNSFVSIAAAAIMFPSKVAKSFEMVIIARGLFGFSAGIGASIHLLYLGEISPGKIRGPVSLTSGIFMSIGKLSGDFCGLSELLGREELWNVLLSVPACFSLVQLLVLPFFPEAPRYLLIEKGDVEACKKALQSLWGQGEYEQEIEEMKAEQAAIKAAGTKTFLDLLRDSNVQCRFFTIVIINSCVVLSGMAVINLFSYDIFLSAGIAPKNIRYFSAVVGVIECIGYCFCSFLIERTGRRPLLWGGFGGLSACLVSITVTLDLKECTYWVPYITISVIILFIIFFSGGPAGVAVSLNNEVFIQSERSAAFVLLWTVRWFWFGVMSMIFPFLIIVVGSYCFVLFACTSLLGSLFTFFFLPETKGKSLLEISEAFRAIAVCGKSLGRERRVETKL